MSTPKQQSPRQHTTAPGAQNKKAVEANPTTTGTEAQGLRFALDRLVGSKHRLIASQNERLELLSVLSALHDPKIAIILARQESHLKGTERRLDDVCLAVSAVESALSRLGGA